MSPIIPLTDLWGKAIYKRKLPITTKLGHGLKCVGGFFHVAATLAIHVIIYVLARDLFRQGSAQKKTI